MNDAVLTPAASQINDQPHPPPQLRALGSIESQLPDEEAPAAAPPAVATSAPTTRSEQDFAKMTQMLRSRIRLAAFKAARGWEGISMREAERRLEEEEALQRSSNGTSQTSQINGGADAIMEAGTDGVDHMTMILKQYSQYGGWYSPTISATAAHRKRSTITVIGEDVEMLSPAAGPVDVLPRSTSNATTAATRTSRGSPPARARQATGLHHVLPHGQSHHLLHGQKPRGSGGAGQVPVKSSLSAALAADSQRTPSPSVGGGHVVAATALTDDEEAKQAAEAILLLASPMGSPSATGMIARYYGAGSSNSAVGTPTPTRISSGGNVTKVWPSTGAAPSPSSGLSSSFPRTSTWNERGASRAAFPPRISGTHQRGVAEEGDMSSAIMVRAGSRGSVAATRGHTDSRWSDASSARAAGVKHQSKRIVR